MGRTLLYCIYCIVLVLSTKQCRKVDRMAETTPPRYTPLVIPDVGALNPAAEGAGGGGKERGSAVTHDEG